jgi:transposase
VLVDDHHSEDQLQDLAHAITRKRDWVRVQAVLLAKRGWTASHIAASLGCSARSVKNWVAQYNRGGIDALREGPRSGRPRRLDPAHYSRLKERIEAPPLPEDGVCTLRASDVRRIIQQEFGVLMGRQAVYDLLHRLGYSDLMPRPYHEDSNPEVQEFFKEVVAEQIDSIVAAHPEEQVRVYFQDEARFGTQGTITRVWARKGSRPRAVRQNGREWLYVLMAVCVSTGAASALIMPDLNTAVINLFLGQFSEGLPAGVHAVLIWDNAGFHTGGGVVVPANVSLIQLPPYSPELNPVENLWHYLRSHHWSNRAYDGYEGLEDEAIRSVCAIGQDAEKLKSICNTEYVMRGE